MGVSKERHLFFATLSIYGDASQSSQQSSEESQKQGATGGVSEPTGYKAYGAPDKQATHNGMVGGGIDIFLWHTDSFRAHAS